MPPLHHSNTPTNRRRSSITFADCAAYFNRPVAQAVHYLGVSRPTISKILRRNGMPRWPYRKLKANNRISSWGPADVAQAVNEATLTTTVRPTQQGDDVDEGNGSDDDATGSLDFSIPPPPPPPPPLPRRKAMAVVVKNDRGRLRSTGRRNSVNASPPSPMRPSSQSAENPLCIPSSFPSSRYSYFPSRPASYREQNTPRHPKRRQNHPFKYPSSAHNRRTTPTIHSHHPTHRRSRIGKRTTRSTPKAQLYSNRKQALPTSAAASASNSISASADDGADAYLRTKKRVAFSSNDIHASDNSAVEDSDDDDLQTNSRHSQRRSHRRRKGQPSSGSIPPNNKSWRNNNSRIFRSTLNGPPLRKEKSSHSPPSPSLPPPSSPPPSRPPPRPLSSPPTKPTQSPSPSSPLPSRCACEPPGISFNNVSPVNKSIPTLPVLSPLPHHDEQRYSPTLQLHHLPLPPHPQSPPQTPTLTPPPSPPTIPPPIESSYDSTHHATDKPREEEQEGGDRDDSAKEEGDDIDDKGVDAVAGLWTEGRESAGRLAVVAGRFEEDEGSHSMGDNETGKENERNGNKEVREEDCMPARCAGMTEEYLFAEEIALNGDGHGGTAGVGDAMLNEISAVGNTDYVNDTFCIVKSHEKNEEYGAGFFSLCSPEIGGSVGTCGLLHTVAISEGEGKVDGMDGDRRVDDVVGGMKNEGMTLEEWINEDEMENENCDPNVMGGADGWGTSWCTPSTAGGSGEGDGKGTGKMEAEMSSLRDEVGGGSSRAVVGEGSWSRGEFVGKANGEVAFSWFGGVGSGADGDEESGM